MVIDKINLADITGVEPKNNSPIGANCHSPLSDPVSRQAMKME